MRRLPCIGLIASGLMFAVPGARGGELAGDISAVLHDKLLARADESVEIVRPGRDPGASSIVYRHDSDQPMIPASNLKVVTTSAALDRLGPDFKFQTKLVEHDGDLILIGDGGPDVRRRGAAQPHGLGRDDGLQQLGRGAEDDQAAGGEEHRRRRQHFRSYLRPPALAGGPDSEAVHGRRGGAEPERQLHRRVRPAPPSRENRCGMC